MSAHPIYGNVYGARFAAPTPTQALDLLGPIPDSMSTEEKIVLYVVDATNGCIATDFVLSGEAISHLERAIGSSLAEALDGEELELNPEEVAKAEGVRRRRASRKNQERTSTT